MLVFSSSVPRGSVTRGSPDCCWGTKQFEKWNNKDEVKDPLSSHSKQVKGIDKGLSYAYNI